MKKFFVSLFGALLSSQVHADELGPVPIRALANSQINPETVLRLFKEVAGATLSLDEKVLVSYEEEGANIRFDTLDHFSVVVPIEAARGSENKVDGSGGV